MSVAELFDSSDDPVALDTAELARELVDLSSRLAAMEARWLALLAEFDRREGWRTDGHLSCVDWLVWRCGMGRRTAYDKVRVAPELDRRSAVRQRFAVGRLSYSKVRAITRITNADEETDEWLLKLAESGTTADLERVARRFEQLAAQDRGVDDYLRRYDRRGVRASRTYDGMMVIEHVLPVEEGEEYLALLHAVDECSAEQSSTTQRRADAVMDLARAGRASFDRPAHVDRYTVHVVAELDALVQQGAVGADRRHSNHGGDPAANRLRLRDRAPPDEGKERAPRRRHPHFSVDGGPTSASNGCLLCPRHHTRLHEGGFAVTGEANATLTFLRPDGTAVGSSTAGV